MNYSLRIGTGLILVVLASRAASSHCACEKVQPSETTHWGGNMRIEMVEDRPLRDLHGVVQLGEKPIGALVEVFANPDKASSTQEDSLRRMAACRTKSDGAFCFPKLAPGRYQLRCSVDTGIDVTFVNVLIDPVKGKDKKLRVSMELGT